MLSSPEMRQQIEARDIVVTNMGPKPFAEEIQRLSRLNAENPTLFLIPYLNETLHLQTPIIFGLSLRRE